MTSRDFAVEIGQRAQKVISLGQGMRISGYNGLTQMALDFPVDAAEKVDEILRCMRKVSPAERGHIESLCEISDNVHCSRKH